MPKAKKASEQVQRALDEGAELVFAWGGDGTVRRCVDVLAGTDASLAVVPAGTANLFATNLGIPTDIEGAVAIGLRGRSPSARRRALRAGALRRDGGSRLRRGHDPRGRQPQGAYRPRRLSLERIAQPRAATAFGAEIEVDGTDWYEGRATCILLGNLGEIFGGVRVFPDARPDDGMLELGIVTAEGLLQWTRTLARTAVGDPNRSPVRPNYEGELGKGRA